MVLHKFLNLHLFPSCFHLVGNLHPREPRRSRIDDAAGPAIKLVTSDGQVKTYRHPVPVSELMDEFPKHLVCRSDTFYIGRKIPALSERDLLEPGQNYFLLPNHFFQSVLTFVTVASFVASRSSAKTTSSSPSKKAAVCKPFDILRTPSGSLRIHVSDEFISQLVEEGKTSDEDEEEKGQRTRLCSTPQLEKDYVRLVEGSRSGRWKPKLETIAESRKEISKRKRKAQRNFRSKNASSSVAAASKIIKMRLRK